ncbi:hypothetical protein [Desulfovibrio sp.]|uniref:hypothetical protein n=1 Tax=Desulfovibrio sp. TaxID=885 RepID=UPI0023BC5B0F|nr:hypothetical protein [Desulfovibrio sp.]MDE7240751.1 hypothetical protein [Desulfovibrio sp.]
MTDNIAAERYAELVSAMRERDAALRKVAALDKRINELAGIAQVSQTHKPSQKTGSPKDFARGCGL